MNPEEQHEPRQEARRLSTGDASRLLLIGLLRPHRPIDEVIERLGGVNGAEWLVASVAAVTAIPPESWQRSTEEALPLDDLEHAKKRAKDAMATAAGREEVAAATAAYFIVIAAAITTHGVTITMRPRGELAEPLAELAAVAPGPWSDLLQRAVVRLANEGPPQAGV